MKRLLYIPILCFVIILSYACDKKKEQSLKDMGLGDDENGQRTYIPINFSYNNASELYIGSFNTGDMKEGRYSVRIEALKGGHENLSSIEYFTVLASEIDKKIKQDSDLARSISEKYFNQYEGDTFEEVIKYREWVAEEIKNTPGLIKAKVAKNGDFVMQFKHLGYSVTIDERFRHGAHLMKNEEVDIPIEASQAPVTPMTTEDKEKYKEIYRGMIKNTPLSNLITDNDTIHSTKVLMLSPMYHDFEGSDAYSNIFPILRDSAYPTFNGSQNLFDIDIYLNENATVDRFRNMHEYGIIILDTHGGYEDGVYTFATGEKASPALDLKYQYELDNQIIKKGQVKSFFGLITFGPEYYIVKDAFFLQNRNIFPNSFVFFSACSSSAKVMDHLDKMGQMFIKNNKAGMYLGFSDTVPVLYSGYLGKILFSNLVTGDTAITAIDKTKKKHFSILTDIQNCLRAKVIIT